MFLNHNQKKISASTLLDHGRYYAVGSTLISWPDICNSLSITFRCLKISLELIWLYDAFLLDIYRPNFEEGHHNFAGIEIQAKGLEQTYISSKLIMQLTKIIFSDSAIFIEKKTVENRLWAKVSFCQQFFYSFGMKPLQFVFSHLEIGMKLKFWINFGIGLVAEYFLENCSHP